MKFRLLSFTSKQSLRRALSKSRHDLKNISSIYAIKFDSLPKQLNVIESLDQYNSDSNKYILVDETYLSLNLIQNGVNICNQLNQVEEIIYKWALSEILQTVNFIQFENETELVANGKKLHRHGYNITRTFEYLTDLYAILNYTKDSFSDGGIFKNPEELYDHAQKLIINGAKVLDLGVESTNPKSANPLSAEHEIKELSFILDQFISFKKNYNVSISIDTRHNKTVKWLLDKDIDIINDVSGNIDLGLVKEITSSGRKYLAMHSLVIPARSNIHIALDKNPVDHIYLWMKEKINQLDKYGINLNNLILDPGIGFGVLAPQSWFVLKNFKQYYDLPCELLIGHSRKSFFKHITKENAQNIDLETAVVAAEFINKVDYLRVHNVQLLNRISRIKQHL